MAVTRVDNTDLDNVRFTKQEKRLPYVATLAAQIALTADFPPFLVLDPGGAAKDVLLPPEADSEGLFFVIKNTADAAEDLVVKEDSDTTTIVTISQNEAAWVFCDGTTWYGMVGGIT